MYPQSMFWSKKKKNRYTPAYPSFTILLWGLGGYSLHGDVFLMCFHENILRFNILPSAILGVILTLWFMQLEKPRI